MNSEENNNTSALLRAIEKLGAIGATAAIIVLIGLYFWVAMTAPAATSTFKIITRDLTLALLTGIIPAFILFVISYALLKEINTFREDEKRESLAKAVTDRVVNSVQHPTADKFFSSKSDESNYINNAAEELFFIQETGSLISESYRSEIISFLRRNGRIKILVSSPDNDTAPLMVIRNSTISSVQSFKARADKFAEHMREIAQSSESSHDQIEVRYLPYPVAHTMVMADPYSTVEDHSKAIVRLAGFKVPYEEKADFSVTMPNSPVTFNSYRDQFESMWLSASKFTLITGNPRSGKTTLINSLIQKSAIDLTYYVFSKEILNREKRRIGFEAITSAFEGPRQFANRNSPGKYEVNYEIWDDVADEINEAIQKGIQLFIIDEIGPMQLSSDKFCSAIENLIDKYSISAYMTVADNSLLKPDSLGVKIKVHPRTKLIAIDLENRDSVKDYLLSNIST